MPMNMRKPSGKTKSSSGEKQKPAAKSWQARISAEAGVLAERFVESLSFDTRLAEHDITGSLAHADMLAAVGLITADECAQIRRGLEEIRADIRNGRFKFDIAQEDIHMAVEADLIRRIGDAGRKLHTGRSRNDQVALDVRLWCRSAIDALIILIRDLQKAFVELATAQGRVVMPAFTHLQRAQPVAFGHELLAYAEMLERDADRLRDCRRRTNISPLGSGAVAGSTLPISRMHTADILGFTGVAANSLDAVSDRDFVAELVFDLSMTAMHLSRWAEQWIIYSSTEFDFIRLADSYTTGSSMMPQKRNPDMLELIRGKTGGVYGQLMAVLAMLKGQPLAYNRDMQEDKRWLFSAYDTVEACLAISAEIVRTTVARQESIARRLDEGFLDATVLAEYLVKKGVAFRTAHQVVGALVARCELENIRALADLPLAAMQEACPAIDTDVRSVLGPDRVVRAYQSFGAGGLKQLDRQLRHWRKKFA